MMSSGKHSSFARSRTCGLISRSAKRLALAHLFQSLSDVCQRGDRECRGDEAVPVAGGAAKSGGTRGAEVNRWAARCCRLDQSYRWYSKELALPRLLGLRPEMAEKWDKLVQATASRLERDSGRSELFFHPAGPRSDEQPALRKAVQ